MISQEKLDSYLNRQRETLSWFKTLPDKDLNDMLDEERVSFKTVPFRHQKIAVLMGIYFQKFMFLIQPGLGKSKIFIDLISHHLSLGFNNSLVVVPRKANLFAWVNEFKIHSDEEPTLGLNNNRIDIVDCATLQKVLKKTVKNIQTNGDKYIPDLEKIAKYKYDIVVVDESHTVKNVESLRSKLVELISEKAPVRFAGTGTVFTRNPLDLWNQFFIIDRGKTFTNNYWFFRECFYKPITKHFGGRTINDWNFDTKKKEKLDEILDSSCLRYSVSECMDLPETSRIIIEVEETKDIRDNDPRHALKSGQLPNVMNMFMRCRTLASGLVHEKDKQLGIDKWLHLSENKSEAFIEYMEDLGDSEPVVIFYEFQENGTKLHNILTKMKLGHETSWIRGGMELGDLEKQITQFMTGKTRIMLANIQTGSTGMNFQRAHFALFYDLPASPVEFIQAEKRIHRTGQNERCVFTFLFTKNSIERKIYNALIDGRDFLAEIMRAPELIMEGRDASQ